MFTHNTILNGPDTREKSRIVLALVIPSADSSVSLFSLSLPSSASSSKASEGHCRPLFLLPDFRMLGRKLLASAPAPNERKTIHPGVVELATRNAVDAEERMPEQASSAIRATSLEASGYQPQSLYPAPPLRHP